MPRALIVCDVDEVVIDFVAGFDAYLAPRGLMLDRSRFALSGNIRDLRTGEPVTDHAGRELISNYQRDAVHRTPAVTNAVASINRLAESAEICFLTNALPGQEASRRAHLADLGLPYPVRFNAGEKGAAVRSMAMEHRAAHAGAPVVFVDDSPRHLASVAGHVSDAILVQFIADDAFRALVRPADHVALLSGDWTETAAFIEQAATRTMEQGQ